MIIAPTMNQLSSVPSFTLTSGVVALPHLGIIRVQGADAARFLHNQLTQDFVLLPPQQARLSAYLTPKGRMLASFIAWQRAPEEFLLVCSRDVLPATLKRLSMFVLRAKVTLSDASTDFALYGLVGDAIHALGDSASIATNTAAPAWSKTDCGPFNVVHLYPADGQSRALCVAPAGTSAPQGPALDVAAWLWSEVQSGVATLSAPVVDAFVPQMLNYESLDGIHFKKGCYPGQEVVARSQFRGTLKRRTYLTHITSTTPVAVGAEIFTRDDATQPVGHVVQVAQAPHGGYAALVVLQVAAASAATTAPPSTPLLHVGHIDGPSLTLSTLPYALREDI